MQRSPYPTSAEIAVAPCRRTITRNSEFQLGVPTRSWNSEFQLRVSTPTYTRHMILKLLILALLAQTVTVVPRPPAQAGPPRPEDGSAAPDGYAPQPQCQTKTRAPRPAKSAAFRVESLAEGLSGAFCFSFLPDGRIIVGERPGRIRIVSKDGKISEPVSGMP